MSVPLRLVAAEAKVTETKGGLGINSALTSSFRILSHAKRRAARWAEGDADNYSLTLSHHWRLTLQTDWQMKRAEIASIKNSHLPEQGGDHLQYLVSNGKRKKMSAHGKLSSQFRTLQRPFRVHAQNTQWHWRGFKAQIQWNIKIKQRLSRRICIRLFFPLNLKTFHTVLTNPLPCTDTDGHKLGLHTNIHWLAKIALFIKRKSTNLSGKLCMWFLWEANGDVHCPAKHVDR